MSCSDGWLLSGPGTKPVAYLLEIKYRYMFCKSTVISKLVSNWLSSFYFHSF